MISVDHLTVRAGSFAIEDVTFAVPTGQYAVMMGKTGSGKTTVLEAICGLKSASAGTIRFFNRDVTRLKSADRGVGYVPQDRALFPNMTVGEHLAFALLIRRWPPDDVSARVAELASLLGIEKLLDRRPLGLSGGEAQRVALGRALAFRPSFLMLDEPLSALDEETREGMCDLLKSIQSITGVTTLHVTHSMTEAKRLADQLLVIRDGTIQTQSLNGSANGSPVAPMLTSITEGRERQ